MIGPVRTAAVGALLLFVAGCEGDPVVVPVEPASFLYLILGQPTPFQGLPEDPWGQHAVLLQMSSPVDRMVLRSGERFELRRAEDGARFDWEDLGRDGEPWVDASEGVNLLRAATHRLTAETSAAGLGTDSLTPLTRYILEIELDGTLITGRVQIPAAIEPHLSADGRAISWDPVQGAVGYRIIVGIESTTTTEPVYILTAANGQTGSARVQALERNAWTYFTDPDAIRAGIDTGRGVFGAISETVVEW